MAVDRALVRRRGILIELGATALVVFALTISLVGFHIKDVSGGLSLELRYIDVMSAVIIAIIGRGWLILVRHGHYWWVSVTATLTATILIGSLIFGGAIVQKYLPFKAGLLQWLLAIVSAGFAVGSAIRGVRKRNTTPLTAEGLASFAEDTSFMDRVSAQVQRSSVWIGAIIFLFAAVFPFLPGVNLRYLDIGVLVLTYVMLGWGLNIVVGLAGLLDLGYVAFYAVGAYSFALLASPDSPLLQELGWTQGISFWVCMPFAGLMAALAGVALGFPVLRLRGDYLAIVTLGFGEMIRVTLLNFYSLTKGPDGISKIPPPSLLGYSTEARMDENTLENTTEFHTALGIPFDQSHTTILLYFVILIMALATNFFTVRVRKLPVGRAWEALREDEIACRSLGINPTNTKLTAFGIGAMFGGFAGSFFATRQTFVSPESFTFIESAVILAIVVLGGFGSQIGVVVASFLLIGLPEMFRELQEYRMLFFGGSMVLVMLWRPAGLLAHREPTIRLYDGKCAGKAEAAAR